MLEALSTPSPKWYRSYIGNPNNYNNAFFPWVWCTSFVLYFFCGIQALTSLPSKNTVTYNLAAVIRNLPGLKEEPVDYIALQFSSVQFSCSVVSDSLRPHESQHARPPCPSQTPGVHSDSRPSSWWCHPAISSSVIPFSSCPQSLPASESFPMSTLQMRWSKYWSFSFSIISSKEIPGLISFRMDWVDLLAVQGTLKSLLQYQNIALRTAETSPKRSCLGKIPREITDIYAHCSYPYGRSHPIRKLVPDFSWSDQWHYLIPGRHSSWPQLTGQGCYKWQDCPRLVWGPRQSLYNHQYILLHLD